jgi:hypothetical protein
MPTDRDDDLDAKGRSSISDIMKKALFAGIGAVFMTEESVRGYVAEAKLPREIRNYIIQNTTQAKEQFFSYLSKELSQVVMKSDLPKVVQRFLSDHTIEVEAKIRFRSNGSPEILAGARATPTQAPAPTNGQTTPPAGTQTPASPAPVPLPALLPVPPPPPGSSPAPGASTATTPASANAPAGTTAPATASAPTPPANASQRETPASTAN